MTATPSSPNTSIGSRLLRGSNPQKTLKDFGGCGGIMQTPPPVCWTDTPGGLVDPVVSTVNPMRLLTVYLDAKGEAVDRPITGCVLRVFSLLLVGVVLPACTTVPVPTAGPTEDGSTGSATASAPTVRPSPTLAVPAVLWRRDDPLSRCCFIGHGSALAAVGKIVLVADGYEGGTVTALSLATGDELWSMDTGGTTVFVGDVDHDTLLVHGKYGWLAALDTGTGSQRWRIELDDDGYGVAGAVLLRNHAVVTTTTPSEGDDRAPYVFQIDVDDGQVEWRTDLGSQSEAQWAPPVVHGEQVFVQTTPDHPGSATNVLHAIDIDSGRLHWATDLGGGQGFFETPAAIAGDVIVARGQAELHGISTADGRIVWSTEHAWPLWARDDGTVVLSVRSRLVAVRAADGAEISDMELSGPYDPASISTDVAADRIVLATPQAVLTLRRSNVDLIWRHSTDVPPAEIALSGTTVVAMFRDGSVAALEPST